MDLAQLFSAVMEAPYVHVEKDASFSARVQNGTLYLFFQWSQGKTDWESNLDFPAVPYRDMPDRWMCHRGFLSVFQSAQPYVSDILKRAQARKTVIAGYSHGGALAMLCHEYIWFTQPPRRQYLTGVGYGAPRVLFAPPGMPYPKERWETFTAVRNAGDIVTHLPPVFLGYRHAGHILTVGERGRYTPIDAHRPENYEKALARYVKESAVPWHV